MIERDFIAQKTKEYYIKQHIEGSLRGVGISDIRLKKIPLGEKIIISTNRPSIVVGSKGSNIKDLTKVLKQKFKLENPQIEINEVKNQYLDANIVAQRIVGFLERFGSARFKSVGHKTMENVIRSGALGVEIIMSGKIPGARAKSWRFYQGYLKKCGDIALTGVRHAHGSARLKSGIIGVKVSIMPPGLQLPDSIELLEQPVMEVEEVTKEAAPETKTEVASEQPATEEPAVEESAEEEKTPAQEESNEQAEPAAEQEESESKTESQSEEETKEESTE